MKDIILLFNTACIYEIVISNYFLKFTNSNMVFCSLNGTSITSMEGYSIDVNMKFSEIDMNEIRSIIIPGGDISSIKVNSVFQILKKAKGSGKVIAGICAGVDVLEASGILEGVESTHSTDLDVVRDKHIITSRANAYVDFAIELGKELNLFRDEVDLEETVQFWKYHKRME